jgi:hypothetical protein
MINEVSLVLTVALENRIGEGEGEGEGKEDI